MKAILVFNTSNPDENLEYARAVKSSDMASVLFEITSNLQKSVIRRFEDDYVEYDVFDGVHEVFNRISEILADSGINIDELIN